MLDTLSFLFSGNLMLLLRKETLFFKAQVDPMYTFIEWKHSIM